MKVGIFGYYSYRNIGDDAMALLFSSHVKSEGHEPIIFNKSPSNMSEWGFTISSNVADFVKSSDIIIIGGGGILIPRPVLSVEGNDFNNDLSLLLELVKTKSIPLFGFSIGGSGKRFEDIMPLERQSLLKSLSYATVRNKEDLQVLDSAGVPGEFLSDVVWTIEKSFPVETQKKNRKKIGISLYLGKSRRFLYLATIIDIITYIRKDLDFVFYDIHPEENNKFRAFKPEKLRANCSLIQLTDIRRACEEAASLDLLITTRLHLGVMAMCYGVASIAYAGQEKTRLLYNRIGRSDFYWRSNEITNFLRVFLIPGALARLATRGAEPVARAIVDNAMLHYDRISEILAAGPGQPPRMDRTP